MKPLRDLLDDVHSNFYGTPVDTVWDAVEGFFSARDKGRLAWIVVLAVVCWPGLFDRHTWIMVMNFSVVVWIHEGGHSLFMLPGMLLGEVGHFITIAAGSGTQLAVPIALMVFAYRNGFRFETAVLGFWLALNFVDVSVYAGDAVERRLPLIFNGGPEGHDWGNMLTMLHLLWATPVIAGGIWLLGFVTYWASIVAGAYLARKDWVVDYHALGR